MSSQKKTDDNLIVALDIGTSKVIALIARCRPDDELEIIAYGAHPTAGLKRGVVIDIEATVEAISRATEEAELMAGCEIRSAYVSISGSHVRSLNSHGIVAIHDREVTYADVERVIEAAQAVAIPADQKVFHVLPQEFIIDNEDSIREPVGMSGVRLEAKVHMVTGAMSSAQNIVKCVNRCGLMVSDIILGQLASSYAVLTEDEKELGVCVVDMGGGTTDMAIFTEGAIRHTPVIPIAGDQVTNDIAVALRTPTPSAEAIKLEHGCAMAELTNEDDIIDVSDVGGRVAKRVSVQGLAEVIEARYEELFLLIKAELRRSGFEDLIVAGVVLTGGSAQIPGVQELAQSVLQLPVRIGKPQAIEGMPELSHCPSFATAIGLLLYAHSHGAEQRSQFSMPLGMNVGNLFGRVKQWFVGNF